MGKILSRLDESIPEDLLSIPVLPNAQVLIGCMDYVGALIEIRRVYERFRRTQNRSGYHLSLPAFQVVTHNSPIEGLTDAYATFERGSLRTVNVLEFISALVLVSGASWRNKGMFLMRLFDFDNNKCLSLDEITIMCTSIMNGFSSIIGRPRLPTSVLKRLSDFVFNTADINPDGLVTYDE
jgi:hypothetical protein